MPILNFRFLVCKKLEAAREKRAKRALVRQLAYQRQKARRISAQGAKVLEQKLSAKSLSLRSRLERFHSFRDTDRVLEVGSGAHGHIFFIGQPDAIGIDPLADHYRYLFPHWQSRALTVAANGEMLPFEDRTFDIVISDNVVDHAADPQRIVCEMVRVLSPGGLLYFTVHIHHWLYEVASKLQLVVFALKLPVEVDPFVDHTVHLSIKDANRLFDNLPIERLEQTADIKATLTEARRTPPRHLGDRLKSLFFKNATFELVGRRLG